MASSLIEDYRNKEVVVLDTRYGTAYLKLLLLAWVMVVGVVVGALVCTNALYRQMQHYDIAILFGSIVIMSIGMGGLHSAGVVWRRFNMDDFPISRFCMAGYGISFLSVGAMFMAQVLGANPALQAILLVSTVVSPFYTILGDMVKKDGGLTQKE